jgi:outer membrane protein TolC
MEVYFFLEPARKSYPLEWRQGKQQNHPQQTQFSRVFKRVQRQDLRGIQITFSFSGYSAGVKMQNVFLKPTSSRRQQTGLWALAALSLAGCGAATWAQTPEAQPPAPVVLTLDEALHRAEANEPAFAAAVAASRSAAQDRWIARGSLLPGVVYHNQATYNQSNGAAGQTKQNQTQKFISNNGVHEYMSQAVVNETLGLGGLAEVRHADAAAAEAAAEMEVARRGLVAAVSALFYGTLAADRKLQVAERASREAQAFTTLTQQREAARESAHADVVKARLEELGRQRDTQNAKLAAEKARLELGVLLFPDPRTQYALSMPENPPVLAGKDDVAAAAAKNNAELKSALAALRTLNADVLTARAAYLPSLGLNYTYGIDAAQFATNAPDKTRNLGYSATATIDLPVWDWFNTQHRIKQSEIKRTAAQVALTATQRRLIARLDEAYSEAAAARDQLASLEQSSSTAEESLRLTRMRYTSGEGTVLEVVDAQNAYVSAENEREDGRMRYQAALSDLQTLTGSM